MLPAAEARNFAASLCNAQQKLKRSCHYHFPPAHYTVTSCECNGCSCNCPGFTGAKYRILFYYQNMKICFALHILFENTMIFVENSRLTKFYSRYLFRRKKDSGQSASCRDSWPATSVPFSFWLCLVYKTVARLSDVNYVEKTPVLA